MCAVGVQREEKGSFSYLWQSCRRDGGRPAGAGRRRLASNHLKRLLLRVMVVSVEEKSEKKIRQVRNREMSKPEPLLRRRNQVILASKPGSTRYSGISLQVKSECCAGGVRREGGMNLFQALLWNCGNQSHECKGRLPSGETIRDRVPMSCTGAEQPVVVKKLL